MESLEPKNITSWKKKKNNSRQAYQELMNLKIKQQKLFSIKKERLRSLSRVTIMLYT